MKNIIVIFILSFGAIFCVTGCSTLSESLSNVAQNHLQDIHDLSRIATRVTIMERNMSTQELNSLERYLFTVKDLTNTENADLTNARMLATKLDKNTQFVAMIVLDLIERYLNTIYSNINSDQQNVLKLINAAIDGAIDAVQESKTQ